MSSDPLTRRRFLGSMAATGAISILGDRSSAGSVEPISSTSDETLTPWIPGSLEIHHISTGRGNCAFILCPDGTTLLIDAGAQYHGSGALRSERYLISPKPDASLRPGQWIARYIQRRLRFCENKKIDYFILTHLHTDHMGGLNPDPAKAVKSKLGNYELTGVSDVHEQVGIRRLIDRAYPDYNYPAELDDPHQKNYRAFVASFLAGGGHVERFIPGAVDQIVLQHGPQRDDFQIRNLAANGEVWTGKEASTVKTFPDLKSLPMEDRPNENMCSLALRLVFGAFSYYNGGDLVHETHYGRLPWADIESAVALAAGPTTVALANHHGYVNGCGPEFVRQLRPRVFIISAWDSAHPTIPSLDNMLSSELYSENRLVFATALKPENIIATKRLAELKSGNGHVIVRVASPKAEDFQVFITDNMDQADHVVTRTNVSV